jgi:hypothetical protein
MVLLISGSQCKSCIIFQISPGIYICWHGISKSDTILVRQAGVDVIALELRLKKKGKSIGMQLEGLGTGILSLQFG